VLLAYGEGMDSKDLNGWLLTDDPDGRPVARGQPVAGSPRYWILFFKDIPATFPGQHYTLKIWNTAGVLLGQPVPGITVGGGGLRVTDPAVSIDYPTSSDDPVGQDFLVYGTTSLSTFPGPPVLFQNGGQLSASSYTTSKLFAPPDTGAAPYWSFELSGVPVSTTAYSVEVLDSMQNPLAREDNIIVSTGIVQARRDYINVQ
jgi:hypothetical protein